ncbi:alpha/beta fold hydrolase [Massilia sp. IC2-477]|uniref:S9 family peptidase n=1 Tax=Massilia sp. IC2-477 TaxID=2887198 RepID=UPI001D114751|nr:S9 family peptidase [Massilia sp. IC2-477]MCC2954526.1 alpha/beta fold hydrolase [Massilia sp. IC2-477]
MRPTLLLLAALAAAPASAERLTLDRIYGDPALAGASVKNLRVSPDGERVTFLRGRADNQYQLDLWEYNMKTKSTQRLVDSKRLVPNEELSLEEKARRERARTAGLSGILNYFWSPDGKQLLVPIGGDLYLVDAAKPDAPRKVASGNVIDPKISPKGRYVSFVRNQNLVVIDLQTGAERQLTTDGKGTIHNGEAEFVAQEEMDQHTGYYWAPDDSAIAYRRYDEKPVPVVRRFEIFADRTEVIDQHYPAAGDPNVLIELMIVNPATGQQRKVDLGAEKDIYLVRADFSDDAKTLVYQRQTRDQKRLDLVAVDVNTLAQRPLLTETSKTWVSIHNDLRFLRSKKAFIWASERSGRNHLYLYGLDGKLMHPLTKGEWGVDNILAIDETDGKVYVSSNKDAVIDKQTYAVKLDGSNAGAPLRVTAGDGWHDAVFARNGKIFVDTYSNPKTPPQVSIRRADGSMVEWLEKNELNANHPYAKYMPDHLPTEFGTMKAKDGQTLHYSIIKPANFDASKRYPVFLFTYGGPHSQRVTRTWGNYFDQYMAQQGFVVFRLDNRGSSRRERVFTDALYNNLGKVEVEDQVTGIDWLAQQSFVDPKRIGVFGWSYGGFMTLRLLSAASDKIAMGVSVAPVTDWALYDTHYTEQFVGGTPKSDPEAYKRSGVFAHLDGLKSPLLLIHGMADDNVLFTNTTRLIDELVKRNVQFDLMTYPGAKHGISGKVNQRHVYGLIEAFFKKNLGGTAAK